MDLNEQTKRMLAAAERVDNLDMRVRDIEIEMAQHDAQCEERWKTTFNRLMDIEDTMKQMESRLLVGAGSMILFLAGVIVTLLMQQMPVEYEIVRRGGFLKDFIFACSIGFNIGLVIGLLLLAFSQEKTWKFLRKMDAGFGNASPE